MSSILSMLFNGISPITIILGVIFLISLILAIFYFFIKHDIKKALFFFLILVISGLLCAKSTS